MIAARHLGFDEMVAIKVLLPSSSDDPAVVERFLQEGKAAVKIRSEHVVRMIDVGLFAGRAYLVMEHLDGKDLEALVREGGPLALVPAVDMLLQACEAIGEAHALGIIHRDLKPANLFLTHRVDGAACVKVLDFGISKMPRSGLGERASRAHRRRSRRSSSRDAAIHVARADDVRRRRRPAFGHLVAQGDDSLRAPDRRDRVQGGLDGGRLRARLPGGARPARGSSPRAAE